MIIRRIIWGVLLTLNFGVFGQSATEALKEKAYDFFSYADYENARPLLLKLDSLDPGNPKVNYEIGICWIHSMHQENALPYFKKAKEYGYKDDGEPDLYLSVVEKYVSEDLDFNLARAYHLHHEFDKAIEAYRQYEKRIDKNDKKGKEDFLVLERFIARCEDGKELIKDTHNVSIENMGPTINSEFPEYVPVVSADESLLIFTSRRNSTTGGKKDPQNEEQYMEDILISYKDSLDSWSTPKSIGKNINTDEHDASIGLSPDGQKLFIYKNDHHHKGNIWVSNLEGEHWSEPIKMQDGINGKHSWEGSASISADEKLLFFSSDRANGKGGKDIYMAKLLPNNKWAEPILLGDEINTDMDEDAPFIHADGVTLYFSSKGHKNMGGYDIFKSTYNPEDGSWTKAENVGYPINSADDDIFFVFSPDGKRAYFSSHHEDSYGDQDIYVMHLPEQKETSLIVLKGKISASDNGSPIGASITVTDNESGNIIGIYNSNSFTGKYVVVIPPGKNYGISVDADGFLPYSENINLEDKGEYYEVNKDIKMKPLVPGSVLILKNVFFDYDSSTLRKESFIELDKYAQILIQKPTIYVEIAGHTDSIGSKDYNLKLSQSRAESVVKYLVSKGVEEKRFLAVGYGKKHPIAKNTNPDGTDNPEGRQLNRRTELIVHETLVEGKNWKRHYGSK